MVCTANDLLEWNDFPKGLRVLLLDEDSNSSDKIKSKLEHMDYIVFSFCNENEALAAISNRPDTFHVAIIEVSTENSDGRLKFLEAAKDLPTIMISNMQCLSTMMKCIALGAIEFLLKPLSDDKLKNIWQHVVHRAFNAGGKHPPKSLKSIKESMFLMLSSQLEDEEKKSNLLIKSEENKQETSAMSDKFPAPPTPQFVENKQQISTNFLTERDNGDQDGESKFVETTSCNIVEEVTIEDGKIQNLGENIVRDEDQGHTICKSKNCLSSQTNNKVGLPCGKKANRKKMKVDWTPNLHKKFVQAVEQLGVDQAIPSRILEMMKVEGLTRHNIASHLQKYRMQHRPILPKEDDRIWPQRRDLYQRSYYPHRPIMAYPMWAPHGSYPSRPQMWGPPYYPPWQSMESWHWQTYPGMNADSWGCPVMLPPLGSCQPPPQKVDGFYNANVVHNSYGVLQESVYHYPGEEEIDRVVKEAISKPWLPLPIGLNPPSTDSVLTELSKLPPCHVIIRHH